MTVLSARRVEERIAHFRALCASDAACADGSGKPRADRGPDAVGSGLAAGGPEPGAGSAALDGALPFSVACHDVLPSTNAPIKDALRAGCAEGAVCMALEQRDGYGRQGRAWASPAGGAYVSVALRPQVSPAQLPTLSLVASLAVRSALVRLGCAQKASIKWPNDVVCPDGKLCGISLEALAGGVCVGIGVNVLPQEAGTPAVSGKNTPAFAFPDAPAVEGSVDGAQARLLEDVAACVLAEFDALYGRWCADGFAPLCEAYNAHLSLRGAFVEATSMTGAVLARGQAERADEAGRLLLRQPDGSLFAANSGEIHLSKVTAAAR